MENTTFLSVILIILNPIIEFIRVLMCAGGVHEEIFDLSSLCVEHDIDYRPYGESPGGHRDLANDLVREHLHQITVQKGMLSLFVFLFIISDAIA